MSAIVIWIWFHFLLIYGRKQLNLLCLVGWWDYTGSEGWTWLLRVKCLITMIWCLRINCASILWNKRLSRVDNKSRMLCVLIIIYLHLGRSTLICETHSHWCSALVEKRSSRRRRRIRIWSPCWFYLLSFWGIYIEEIFASFFPLGFSQDKSLLFLWCCFF